MILTTLIPTLALLQLSTPPPERAHRPPIPTRVGQAQFTLVTGMAQGTDFGLLALRGGGSNHGFGSALGFGYEGLMLDDGLWRGGFFELAFEWRPLETLNSMTSGLHRGMDPRIGLAFLFGGLGNGDEDLFRVSLALDCGVDIALGDPDRPHPVLSVSYRVHAAQLPSDATRHWLMLGIGYRSAQ